jgi:excisionase family DNA binding protein
MIDYTTNETGDFASPAELCDWLEFLAWINDPDADLWRYAIVGGTWTKVTSSPAPHPRAPRKVAEQPGSLIRYLTLQEAGALTRTPSETIRYWIWQGRLTAYRPGRSVLVREDELQALIVGRETRKIRAASGSTRRRVVGK